MIRTFIDLLESSKQPEAIPAAPSRPTITEQEIMAHLRTKYTDEQLNEFFGPFRSQAKRYPNNEFAQYGDGKVADNGKKHPEIDNHPRYAELCDMVDYANGLLIHKKPGYSAYAPKVLAVASEIADDTGFGAFSIQRYAGKNNRYDRETPEETEERYARWSRVEGPWT